MRGLEFIQRVQKAEAEFHKLVKFDESLMAALAHLDEAARAGHLDPKHVAAIRKEVATDKLLGSAGVPVGNFAAYRAFAKKPRSGIHVHMDGNSFGQINKRHGFEAGNQAIQQMGRALREAMDESVGRKQGKLFRVGGDEFRAHVPTHEHAAVFARKLREKLSSYAPIGGTHGLSMSFGFGNDPDAAEKALISAKGTMKARKYPVGQEKSHAHSLVSGFEGPIPVDDDPTPLSSSVVR